MIVLMTTIKTIKNQITRILMCGVECMIAAGRIERDRLRKVRASQGRMPDNVRRRRLQG